MGLRTCMAWTTSTKKQIIAYLMITGNWRRQKTTFSFISIKGGLKLFNSLYVRWWLPNVKSFFWQQWSEIECCAKSNKVWSFLDLHRYCLLLFYFVNSWIKTVTYLPRNSSWIEEYNEGRRTNWLSYWLVDELQDCDSKFIRRLVEVLCLVIHTPENFKPLIYKMPSAMKSSLFSRNVVKSSLFSRNVAWCLQVKHTLVREISQLIWTIYSVLFNFPFEINMTTLNNALQNSPTSSWADITITIFNLASWAGVFFEFLVCCCFLFLHLQASRSKR